MKGQIDGVGTRPRLKAEGADKKALVDQTYDADKIPDLPAAIQLRATGCVVRRRSIFSPSVIGSFTAAPTLTDPSV